MLSPFSSFTSYVVQQLVLAIPDNMNLRREEVDHCLGLVAVNGENPLAIAPSAKSWEFISYLNMLIVLYDVVQHLVLLRSS